MEENFSSSTAGIVSGINFCGWTLFALRLPQLRNPGTSEKPLAEVAPGSLPAGSNGVRGGRVHFLSPSKSRLVR